MHTPISQSEKSSSSTFSPGCAEGASEYGRSAAVCVNSSASAGSDASEKTGTPCGKAFVTLTRLLPKLTGSSSRSKTMSHMAYCSRRLKRPRSRYLSPTTARMSTQELSIHSNIGRRPLSFYICKYDTTYVYNCQHQGKKRSKPQLASSGGPSGTRTPDQSVMSRPL